MTTRKASLTRQQLREKLIEIVDPMVYADGTVHKDDPRIDQLEHLIDAYVAGVIGEDLDPKYTPYEYTTSLSINKFIAEQRRRAGIGENDV